MRPPLPVTEQEDVGSEWSAWGTGCVCVRETGAATGTNRLENEGPEQNKGRMLMLYKY